MTWTEEDADRAAESRAADVEASEARSVTVSDLIRALSDCPLDAQVAIGLPGGGMMRYTRYLEEICVVIVDEDGRKSETVVLWPRVEGT